MTVFTHALSTNNYGPAAFIVDSNAANGTHTTIQAAITAAVSGQTVFVRPGSYTENLTLKAGVNLCAYDCDSFTPNVTIIGTLAGSYSGTVTISGIRLQTNSAAAVSLTGANATILNLIYCNLNFTNNDGISSTGSNAAATINCYDCTGDLGTTGIKIFNVTNGTLEFRTCYLTNSGASTTASTASGSSLVFRYCSILSPITTSGTTCAFSAWSTNFDTNAQNVSPINSNSTLANTCILRNCDLTGGTATALTIGASSTVIAGNLILRSTNATAVSGSGTLIYAGINQVGTVGTISPTTTTGKGTVGVLGSTTPPAGYIGEEISATVTNGSPVSLVNATPKTITSIVLTPGIWDISSVGAFSGYTTATQAISAISANNNSLTGTLSGNSRIDFPVSTAANSDTMLSIPAFRVSLSAATTTYYLVAQLAYTVGSGTGYGTIRAKRVA